MNQIGNLIYRISTYLIGTLIVSIYSFYTEELWMSLYCFWILTIVMGIESAILFFKKRKTASDDDKIMLNEASLLCFLFMVVCLILSIMLSNFS